VSELKGRYGEAGLRECSLLYLYDHPAGTEYPEDTEATAEGIVYLLADEETVPRLLQIRERLRSLPPVAKPENGYVYWHNPLKSCERLIAAVCYRLNKPLPDGIPPIENFSESDMIER
jgi:hypothetical protein